MSKWGNKEGFESFFNDKIIIQKDTCIRANLLFDEYESYCAKKNYIPITYATFLNEFKKKNILVKRDGTNGYYNYIHDVFYCNNGIKIEKEISQAIPSKDISSVIQQSMFKNLNPHDMNTIANRANISFSTSRTKELQEKLNKPMNNKEEKIVENTKKVEDKSNIQPQSIPTKIPEKKEPEETQLKQDVTHVVGSGLISKIIDTTIKLQIDQANLDYYLSMYKIEQLKKIKSAFTNNTVNEVDILKTIDGILNTK